MDGVDTGVLISDFTLHLGRKNVDVPDIYILLYSMLLDEHPLWFSTRMPKLKIEEAGSLSKCERQKLQRLYTQGAAAYGSVRSLVKASRIPVSKVRQFLHSKFFLQKIYFGNTKIQENDRFC